MLKRKKLLAISIILVAFILGVVILAFKPSFLNRKKSLHKNLGTAYVTISVNKNGETIVTPEIDSIIPSKEELIKKLDKAGYTITSYDSIQDIEMSVDRIYAEKKDSFIDICYNLSETDGKNVFHYYEDTYDEYYLMAQNETYVYCISDKKTFKKAGFKSLANNGIQYIYE